MQTAWDNTAPDNSVERIALANPAGEDPSIVSLLARLSLLAAGPDASRVPDEAANAAIAMLDADIAVIRTLSPDEQSFVVTSAAGPSPVMTQGLLGTYTPVTSALEHVRAGHGLAVELLDGPRSDYLVANEYWMFEQLGVSRALIVPLFAGGRLVGRFDIARTSDQPFTSDCEGKAGLLASVVASALNVERLTAESRDATVHRAIFGLYQQIEHLADPRTILQAAVELTRREPGCDRSYAMLWNDDRREFMPIAVSGIEPQLVEMLKMISLSPQVVPAIDRMMHSGETIIVDDAATSTMMPRSLVEALGTQAAMFVPLRGRRHRTLGFMLLDYNSHGARFSEADERVMAGMAQPLSTMIENAMLYEDVVASSDSLAVINEIGIQLAMLTDEESLFRQLHHQVGSVVDGTYFALGLLDEDRQEFDLRVAADGEFERYKTHFSPGSDAIARAIQLGRPSIHGSRESAAPDQWAARIEGSKLCHSQMTVPVTVGRNVVGAMTVRTPFRHAYGPHDLSVFGAIAVHTGVALENARLYRIVQERGDRRAAVLDQVFQEQETERKELVDDIHDNTLQTLAACLYSLDNAHRLIEENKDTGELVSQIESVRNQLETNIDRLRKRIFAVRPATLDVLGLKPALNELIDALQEQSDVQVNLDVRLPGRLATAVETAVYRLIQAALSIHMVPGRSGIITARVRSNTSHVVITVNDFQGRPTTNDVDDETDIAMLALIERTELLGGSIRRSGSGGSGSSLQITLPLDESAPDSERYLDSTSADPEQRHGGGSQ
ncbi:MAG: GAF domain-containing protein [Thermomicrobiales bacterium]